jgi:hypothetical protein
MSMLLKRVCRSDNFYCPWKGSLGDTQRIRFLRVVFSIACG